VTASGPDARLAGYQARVEAALDARLPPPTLVPGRLHAAMRYSTLGGGKRIRPALLYATGEMLGVPLAVLDAAATAVEMIHVYSLVHDDLPAMDDDDLRRGRPTCHRQFDEATAILAGDALQVLAFESLADAPAPAERRVAMIKLLAGASGTHGMAGGQAIDLAAVGLTLAPAEVEAMHRRKTGALIEASVLLAVTLADDVAAAARGQLARFAAALGLAFQIVDDILDVEGAAKDLGKTAGKDARAGKPTYPSIYGLDASRRLASERMESAIAALGGAGLPPGRLGDIAAWVIKRTN
jgi:farnesyl diphosphate synthase